MSDYTYEFFQLLLTFWHINVTFKIDDKFITFIDSNTQEIVLQLKKQNKSGHPSSTEPRNFSFPTMIPDSSNSSSSIPDSELPTSSKASTNLSTPAIPESSCSSPRPSTPGKLILSQKNRNYCKDNIRYKLQEADLYTLINDNIEQLKQFKESLHQAEGPILTPKTKNHFNNLRKILIYLAGDVSIINYNYIFNTGRLTQRYETLIACGIKGLSLATWTIGLEKFN